MKYYLTKYDALFGEGELDIWREDPRQFTRIKRLKGRAVPPHGFAISNGMIKRCTIAESDSIEELVGMAALEALEPAPLKTIKFNASIGKTPKHYMKHFIHVDEV